VCEKRKRSASALHSRKMVRWKGFEPSRYCYRQPLKLVRLPVPPPPQKTCITSLPPIQADRLRRRLPPPNLIVPQTSTKSTKTIAARFCESDFHLAKYHQGFGFCGAGGCVAGAVGAGFCEGVVVGAGVCGLTGFVAAFPRS
jgi:hypothetical protein